MNFNKALLFSSMLFATALNAQKEEAPKDWLEVVCACVCVCVSV